MTEARNSHIRFWIVAVLFIVSSINYASRATLSFAAVPLSKEIAISTVQLGYIFSAFGWSYVIGQIPGGALLDKYGLADYLIERFAVIGPPRHCAERLREIAALGVTHISLSILAQTMQEQMQSMRIVADEVFPHLR